MTNKAEIVSKLQELKGLLQSEYAVKNIGLFGSFAENVANENSDIDILVELSRPIGWKLFTLEIYLESVFNRKIDLVTKNALKSQLKDRILGQIEYI